MLNLLSNTVRLSWSNAPTEEQIHYSTFSPLRYMIGSSKSVSDFKGLAAWYFSIRNFPLTIQSTNADSLIMKFLVYVFSFSLYSLATCTGLQHRKVPHFSRIKNLKIFLQCEYWKDVEKKSLMYFLMYCISCTGDVSCTIQLMLLSHSYYSIILSCPISYYPIQPMSHSQLFHLDKCSSVLSWCRSCPPAAEPLTIQPMSLSNLFHLDRKCSPVLM